MLRVPKKIRVFAGCRAARCFFAGRCLGTPKKYIAVVRRLAMRVPDKDSMRVV